ncbi:MAG: enoyl-CoA hydratase/isomerase family protein [Planctomycetia bacterium]|nr:enoyl-CoA hydratase/isomerase family protein [Planctomycetia bacterium]
MLFESTHICVSAEYGVATLWLDFAGEPVNALDALRLNELERARVTIENDPFVNVLVVRSAKPAGFCAGLRPGVANIADRAAFAGFGQRVFARLAQLPFVTVAFIDGPCLGVGFELALMCDYRLCVASPLTHLGFPERFTCFGGSTRLRKLMGKRSAAFVESGRTLSGREARDLGLVDRAFCARRAKIELRTFLDELERHPRVPQRTPDETGFAEERRAFAVKKPPVVHAPGSPETLNPIPPVPAVVGLATDSGFAARIVGQSALRGAKVVALWDATAVLEEIDLALARGFVTPLEADQAHDRILVTDSVTELAACGLVFVPDEATANQLRDVLRPRCLVACLDDSSAALLNGVSDGHAILSAWLTPFGVTVHQPEVAHSIRRAA